ncbi:MAG: beta-lactamase family protein [Phycisphaerales bacterium]|nr:beta-lactamase family protein [Phycisphaerales bacterium]
MLHLTLLSTLLLTTTLPAQPTHDPRITKVLAGLRPGIEFTGETSPRWTLEERMKALHLPGLSLAVIDDGKIVWAQGFGLRDFTQTAPVDVYTLFQAASISKPIAAIGVMQLVKQGTLDLDTDINTYLKSWKLPPSEFTANKPVTLRHLLSHSAGLTVHGFAGYPLAPSYPTIQQVLDGVQPPSLSPAVRSERAPGEGFKYSGGGTTIAQLIVSDVTGRDPADFLDQTVLAPLGMKHSTYHQPLPDTRAANAASAHTGPDTKPLEGRWHSYPMVFAAGLWTTPTDLCTMGLAVQRAAKDDAYGPLDPAIIHQMLTVTAEPVGIGYFLAGTGDHQRFSHNGGNDGFLSTFEAYTRLGKGLAIMINADGPAGQILGELARAIKAEFNWPDTDIRTITPAALTPAQVTWLTGTYQLKHAPNVNLVISEENGALTMRTEGIPQVESYSMVPTSPTTLIARDGRVDVRAEGDPATPCPKLLIANGRFEATRIK